MHSHVNEQVTWIVSGKVEVLSGGKTFIVAGGEIIIFPTITPHQLRFLEDTIDVDFFLPARQDWIGGNDTYFEKQAIVD